MISSIGSSAMRSMGGMPPPPPTAQMRQAMFDQADSDGSGGLSVDEFKAMVAQGPGGSQGGQKADLDADFKSFDSNGDGSLTQDELDAGMKSKMDSFRSTMETFGGQGGRGGGGPPPADGGSADGGDDPLQALLAGLNSGDGSANAIVSRLQQLLSGLQGDAAGSTGSSVSVTA